MAHKIVAIITGDIVESRKKDPKLWLKKLKAILKKKGNSPKDWEVFRGDMFQLQTTPELSLRTAIEIKAAIKQIKNLDVRIAIGIGSQEFKARKITESNGEAYTHSGSCFDNLKRRRLAIMTPWENFNIEWNLYLRLSSLTMDTWKPVTAQMFEIAVTHPDLNQAELSKRLKRTQSTISASLNRAGYDEIDLMLKHFNKQIIKMLQ